jgi:hypothetical protein
MKQPFNPGDANPDYVMQLPVTTYIDDTRIFTWSLNNPWCFRWKTIEVFFARLIKAVLTPHG